MGRGGPISCRRDSGASQSRRRTPVAAQQIFEGRDQVWEPELEAGGRKPSRDAAPSGERQSRVSAKQERSEADDNGGGRRRRWPVKDTAEPIHQDAVLNRV